MKPHSNVQLFTCKFTYQMLILGLLRGVFTAVFGRDRCGIKSVVFYVHILFCVTS